MCSVWSEGNRRGGALGRGGAGREVSYNTCNTSPAHTASYSETRALHLSPHQQVHVASFGGGLTVSTAHNVCVCVCVQTVVRVERTHSRTSSLWTPLGQDPCCPGV